MNEIKYPSYWSDGINFLEAISFEKAVCVTLDKDDTQIQTYPCAEKVIENHKLKEITEEQFLSAYNKAHEAIENLITSVPDAV